MLSYESKKRGCPNLTRIKKMGKRKRRGKLNWRSKRANKGRKPCLG
jgi:hypothetical protein